MTTNTAIPAGHIREVRDLVYDVLVQIIDHGKVEIGTKHSAKLCKALMILEGKAVPADMEARAR